MRSFFLILILSSFQLLGQDYTYYHIGDTTDITTTPSFGICLMGGATEDDNGSAWFLEKADGGNIVVIRASGSDGYNDYFFNQLGVTVQSVETIVFNNANASQNSFVQRRLENAEAIWIAGGDQFDYESYWKGGPIEDILNDHVNVQEEPIGGTSAGMAILGDYYFNAENGSATSNDALNNPFDSNVTVRDNFLNMPFLTNTITDTHYDNPDRKGRQTVFMAHMITDNNTVNFGIAADEYVAICIESSGEAIIYGDYPNYDDYAYFLRTNCDAIGPSLFTSGQPLEWSPVNNALEVCVMEGISSGVNIFDLNTWTNVNGGNWESWNVENGNLVSSASVFEACDLSVDKIQKNEDISLFPNPANDIIHIETESEIQSFSFLDVLGKTVKEEMFNQIIDCSDISNGIYTLNIRFSGGRSITKKIVVEH